MYVVLDDDDLEYIDALENHGTNVYRNEADAIGMAKHFSKLYGPTRVYKLVETHVYLPPNIKPTGEG